MGNFIYQGPLTPDSFLFRGRIDELVRLIDLCCHNVQAYALVYGGRQTGKTSLLLRLAEILPSQVRSCRIDFQAIPGATISQVFSYMSKRITQSCGSAPIEIDRATDFIDFLINTVRHLDGQRLVLLLDELGALPYEAREDLANVLRAAFNRRVEPSGRELLRLMVVIAGGVELFDLATTQVSTLHNVCESIYIQDLKQADALELVNDVLNLHKIPNTEALGQAIFSQVHGHPYLTQRIGSILESRAMSSDQMLRPVDVLNVAEIISNDDSLLTHLFKALTEHCLWDASQHLRDGDLCFSRMDDEMTKLELLGWAIEKDGYWKIRNPFLANVLDRRLHALKGLKSIAISSSIKILFLAANPTDTSRLRLGEEFREIQEKLKLAKLRENFRIELPQLSVRPEDISQALLDTQPQIIHFSGHGTTTGALCFEDQIGEALPIWPDALDALFEQFANQVNCVLLNACYSEIQATAISKHIDYVIGMNNAIGDKAAIAFTTGFYQALGAGRVIEDAYKLGCVQIRLQNIPEHLTPVLIKKGQLQP